ncbi:LacI family DNA-binding transcriptional regulator [Ktedonospora formicarum]|uniref:Lac repressor n=1 Tax=Ktedonospora formicarum TaxID=2778364 RepID=A0A8J3MV78_9CHLR|nr:LacI family DNA-binding transcriptional regulator [Ktedonospora formicarum]GHO46220.1 lac repressor [Ktedonospora formicarum]
MTLKKKKITIHDVARSAGVSYQTVSRVLNDSDNVSEKTRKRVLSAMEELDYSPNRVAQILSTNRSHTLELFLVDVRHGGRLANTTKQMAHVAKSMGYSLLVSETDEDNLEEAFEQAASRLVDGVVMYAPRMHISDDDLLAQSHGIPLVRRDYVPSSKLAWIGFDQVYATRIAVEYLINLGHRHIAAIPPEEEIINGYWRQKVWKETLRLHGLTPGPAYGADYTISAAYEATKHVLASDDTFTALLAGTDTMAFGAMRALREHGLRIPDDVSVISFDNAELAAYTEPPLTTVDFKFSKQDEMAVKYLIELLNDPELELHQRILIPNLVIRESTRKLP